VGIRSIGTRQSRISLIEQTAKSEPKISKVRLCQLFDIPRSTHYDADIDKDADQLSKLIGEVKKYNQSQIQQYQTDTPSNKSATATPSVKYDYPITPITSPPSSSANKNQTIPESSESDR